MEHYLPPLATLCLLALVAALLILVPNDGWFPVLVYVVFAAFMAQVLYAVGIKPIDSTFLPSLFVLVFTLKLVGSTARYWMLIEVYDTVGDALRYHRLGQQVAQSLQRVDLSGVGNLPGSQGTVNVTYLTGLVYAFLPPSLLGSYFFFATLAFAGSVLFYRTFRLAFPDANPNFFRLGVFFLPSILFWPSSLGKEAWIFFGSGFVAYGLVKYIRQVRLSGLVLAGLGLLLVELVRPHVAAFMVLSMGGTYLLFHKMDSPQQFLTWFVGGGIVVGLGVLMLQSAGEFLGLSPVSEISWEEVEGFYVQLQQTTTGGGSGFVPPVVFSLTGPFYALVTILFRPFPWEAHNPQAMISALESLVWLGFFWYRRRVFWSKLRSIRKDPWVAFALSYSVITILALTSIGNFGIVARQRVTVLPFVWMLFA